MNSVSSALGGTRYLGALIAKAISRVGWGNHSHLPMVPCPLISCNSGGGVVYLSIYNMENAFGLLSEYICLSVSQLGSWPEIGSRKTNYCRNLGSSHEIYPCPILSVSLSKYLQHIRPKRVSN